MTPLHVCVERHICAPAARVYHCIADFRHHHANFLPPAFDNLRVEAGGFGEGTVLSVTVSVAGRRRQMRMRVYEPEPGRVLTEADLASDMETTFTVDPEESACRVRLETHWQPARGLFGWLERLVAPRLLRRLYADELRRLDQYVQRLDDHFVPLPPSA